MMRLAFVLFKYFPYGGLQRDCVEIAQECIKRGHSVDIIAFHTRGEAPAGINLLCLPVTARQNYKRNNQFANKVMDYIGKENYDGVVGFNKMAGLDVYYAADTCFAAKAAERSFLYRLTGRSRSFVAAEKAVFGSGSKTHILLISPAEQKVFSRFYGTAADRMHPLPPGIQRDRLAPDNYELLRSRKRSELGLSAGDFLLLMVGSGFKTKGLDRSLRAVASLPQALRQRVRLMVVGQDKERPFQRLASSLGISEQVFFLGGRDDVAELMFAADFLLHPAYRENTGTVLLEAVAAQLPILVTDVCGYSFHIRAAQCGEILSSPFQQEQMNLTLASMIQSENRNLWQNNALNYAVANDIFSMPERACDVIERVLV